MLIASKAITEYKYAARLHPFLHSDFRQPRFNSEQLVFTNELLDPDIGRVSTAQAAEEIWSTRT
jgi:hypothetical protein